jgi:hypothetical protein
VTLTIAQSSNILPVVSFVTTATTTTTTRNGGAGIVRAVG